ncbi:hypothetical protein I7I53_04292 [Histoplasma capsulatum var. duboisii H88]|uniref:Uncharacterized protein n=1 Tax=Ajellomyces capsulatus (strain H88) TaxID=544711 RepID=A0A8A1LU97_AJEC8|nr:hypothetical protein I7I53_04292 [Histoplasma capsulatum var. duboisii H88]
MCPVREGIIRQIWRCKWFFTALNHRKMKPSHGGEGVIFSCLFYYHFYYFTSFGKLPSCYPSATHIWPIQSFSFSFSIFWLLCRPARQRQRIDICKLSRECLQA